MTPHNEASQNEIAKTVIMPGDPLRAKMIAEEFLEDYKLVNKVRNMYAYTGYYKGVRITVMASGMGMPSMGIYAYELYKFYDVQTIIRIGSAGASTKDLDIFDIVLSTGAYTTSSYAKTSSGISQNIAYPDQELNQKIIETAQKLKQKLIIGKTNSSDIFDIYAFNLEEFNKQMPNDLIACEMEAFALFYIAEKFGKKAACLLTVVDSQYKEAKATAEERQNSLKNMIKIALETIKTNN